MINYSDVEHRLFALLKEPDAQRRAEQARQLWAEVGRSQAQPVTIDNRALFLYHGQAERVEIVGDWSYWQPASFLEKNSTHGSVLRDPAVPTGRSIAV